MPFQDTFAINMLIRNPTIVSSLDRNIYIFTFIKANILLESSRFLIGQEKDFPIKMFICVYQEVRKITKVIYRVQWAVGLITHELKSAAPGYVQDESHFQRKIFIRNLKAYVFTSKCSLVPILVVRSWSTFKPGKSFPVSPKTDFNLCSNIWLYYYSQCYYR